MSHRVVDRLEVVEIEKGDGELLVIALRFRDLPIEKKTEVAGVDRAGQPVDERVVLRLFVETYDVVEQVAVKAVIAEAHRRVPRRDDDARVRMSCEEVRRVPDRGGEKRGDDAEPDIAEVDGDRDRDEVEDRERDFEAGAVVERAEQEYHEHDSRVDDVIFSVAGLESYGHVLDARQGGFLQ